LIQFARQKHSFRITHLVSLTRAFPHEFVIESRAVPALQQIKGLSAAFLIFRWLKKKGKNKLIFKWQKNDKIYLFSTTCAKDNITIEDNITTASKY
jgi:hypothetical protein